MLSDHVNRILTGIHALAFKAFGVRTTPKGEIPKTTDTLDRLIETTPDYKALAAIEGEESEDNND